MWFEQYLYISNEPTEGSTSPSPHQAQLIWRTGEENRWGGEPPRPPLTPAQPFPQPPLGFLGTR